MSFPTRIDLEFYQSKQKLPAWAQRLEAKKEKQVAAIPLRADPALIDQVVNAHAGERLTSGECSAHNLLSILSSRRRLGKPFGLEEIVKDPGCLINPEKRAAFARKWARRIEVAS